MKGTESTTPAAASVWPYRVSCTVYRVPCTVYRVPCTVYRVPCTVYLVPCTWYRVPGTVYSLRFLPCFLALLCCCTACKSEFGQVTRCVALFDPLGLTRGIASSGKPQSATAAHTSRSFEQDTCMQTTSNRRFLRPTCGKCRTSLAAIPTHPVWPWWWATSPFPQPALFPAQPKPCYTRRGTLELMTLLQTMLILYAFFIVHHAVLITAQHLFCVCVFCTLNWYWHPSISSTICVRADTSYIKSSLSGHKLR